MKALICLAVLVTASIASADALVCPGGMLISTALTTTGVSPNTVSARKAPSLVIQAKSTAGTATVIAETCCFPTCATASDWAPVDATASMSLTGTTLSLTKIVLAPTCIYRANVTVCTGCSVTVAYSCSSPP